MFTSNIILTLLLILTAAWILGVAFSRFGLPPMLGELLAGVILGPPLLGIVGPSPPIETLAELGIFFVMFHTGMEMDPRELLEHIWPSLAVAFGGFALPFVLGFVCTRAFDGTTQQALFVGMGISITAIAVQSVILHSMRINRTAVGHVIIGAAIVDDILALMALSTLLGMARTGRVQLFELTVILVKVAVFFGLTVLAGIYVMPRLTRRVTDAGGKALTFSLGVALLMAYLADKAGLHYIIGAFLAGQFVREEIMDRKVYEAIADRFYGLSYGFLVPVFFVSLSFHLHFRWTASFVLFSTAIILVAIAGKLVGCGIGARAFGFGNWESAVIGFGMNGRGAVELVVAQVVVKLSDQLLRSGVIREPLLTEAQFSALVLMAFVTTLVAPISLRWAGMRACRGDEKASFCSFWTENGTD